MRNADRLADRLAGRLIAALLLACTLGLASDPPAPKGSHWKGDRTVTKGPGVNVHGKVTVRTDDELVLQLRGQGDQVEDWKFRVKGTALTLTDVNVTKGNRRLEDVKGKGTLSPTSIRVEYSWSSFGKKLKNNQIEGVLTLSPAEN